MLDHTDNPHDAASRADAAMDERGNERGDAPPEQPVGAWAAALLRLAAERRAGPIVAVARHSRRADDLRAILAAFAPDLKVAPLPAWDCLPFDGTPPSSGVMGVRAGTLRWLADRTNPPDLVVTTPAAVLQRVPPQAVWRSAHLEFRLGDVLDTEAVERHLVRRGYVHDDCVDEPGEFAFRGRVLDLFPAAAPRPCRVEFDEDGRIAGIRSYDPATQRSVAEAELLEVDPASEIVATDDEIAQRRDVQWLPEYYATLQTLFDYVPGALLVAEPAARERAETFLEQVEEGFRLRMDLRWEAADRRRPVAPERLYLTAAEWQAALKEQGCDAAVLPADQPPAERVPHFAAAGAGEEGFGPFLDRQIDEGRKPVLAASSPRLLRRLERQAEKATKRTPERVADWRAVAGAAPGTLLSIAAPVPEGFADPEADAVVITPVEVFGIADAGAADDVPERLPFDADGLRVGDAVVHLEQGVGLLEGLETVATPDGEGSCELIRLRYADGAIVMLPVHEAGALWRHGADAETVSLDKPESESWKRRRAAVEADIAATAERLTALAKARSGRRAPALVPPPRVFARFAGRFPHPLTPDQTRAADAVLADLAAGRPMDRLVCGDVGFGKTEIALRAAAAAVLAGRQAVVMAPTTILVRQHLQTFRRRFAPFGIEVEELSRMVAPARARRVKAGLADGTLRLVIGTQALAAKSLRFDALGLVIVDEEHKFGAAQKEKMRRLAAGAHLLTLTATPIPRTLETSLIGLQDVSVVATPPAARQPVRTVVTPFDEGVVRQALMRERARGGQSFVVCPRIEDIEPMAGRLRAAVPELDLRVAHGKLPAADLDQVMIGFADGEGDVLLATNIVESGLDVPRANTMIVWRSDRFGLAQLHQLRGRVGRGALRGTTFLTTDPSQKVAAATAKRLHTLEAAGGLAAGFAISERDMEMRGTGDLFGPEQAGRIKLIGTGLYRRLLARATAAARGEAAEDWTPELHIGTGGHVPKEHVPEDEVRLNLYVRIYGAEDEQALEALEDEMTDRFGPSPPPLQDLFAAARLVLSCRRLRIARLDAGPQGVAATFRGKPPSFRAGSLEKAGMVWRNDRLVRTGTDEAPHAPLAAASDFLALVASHAGRESACDSASG